MQGRAVFTAIALVLSSFAILVTGASTVGADPITPVDFEGYSLGSVGGQNGWESNNCGATIDQEVVDTSGFAGAPVDFGGQSLRISNAEVSGCFNDVFTPSTPNDAGEAGALRGGKSTGPRSDHYEAEWTVASANGAYQDGLNVQANPDRGDGARMSYVRMRHTGGQLDLSFFDVQGVDPPATPTPCGPGCANFVETSLGTYDPTVPHTIKLTMDFVDNGPDVVNVYVDGDLKHTGTSWEDYYKLDTESSPTPADRFSRTVDSLLIRAGGSPAPTTLGQGFLIDNIEVETGPAPAPTHTDVTVTPATLVAPTAPSGWYFWNDATDTAGGPGSLVVGPGTPVAGVGSVDVGPLTAASGNGAHAVIANNGYLGTLLSELQDIQYSTYTPAGPQSANAVTLQFDVDRLSSPGAWCGRIVFEPRSNATVTPDTWQTWNASDGLWWSTRNPATCASWSSGTGSIASPQPWSWVLANFRSVFGRTVLKSGSNWNGFDGTADALTIGTGADTTDTTTYDFEPGCSATCYVDASVATSGDGNLATPFKTIQEGVNAVAIDGDVVVAAGTYDEHVTIGKSLHLNGAGDTTVVDPSTDGPAITITSGGTSETDRLVVSSLKTTGAGGGRPNGQGIKLAVASAGGHITFDHVTSTGNTGDGLLQNGAGALEDLVVESSSFSGNVYGGYAVTSGAGEITKLRVDNSHFDDNGTWGWSVFIATSGSPRPTMTDVVVEDSTFSGNAAKGIYLERLDHATLQRLSVISSGDGVGLPPGDPAFATVPHAAGIDINLKYRAFTDITLADSIITGSGGADATNGGGVLFKQRDDAPSYSSPAASVSDVTLSGNTISSNPVTGLRFGEPTKTNNGPTDAHVNQNTISDNTGIGFNAANTSVEIDGECNFYGTNDGPSGVGVGTGDDVSANIDFTPWKIASDSTCPPNAPNAPTGASATAGDGEASVAFTAPSDNGGSLITGYTVTCVSEDPDTEESATGTSSPIVVDDLDNGTTYVCTVFATNGGGDGPVSNFAFVTPATTPDAPTDVVADRANGGAQVTFTAPADDGGAAITGYTATCTAPGPDVKTGTGFGSPINVSGMTNGTEYSCTVHATNVHGDGPESDDDAVTPAAVPDAPTGVTATRGDGEASVAFTAPTNTGGSAITGYTATCVTEDPGSEESATGTTSPIVVDGLDNGELYICSVSATNEVGDGPISNYAFVTPAAVPNAPTDVDAIRGGTSAQVSFTAPDDGGSPITGYTATCVAGLDTKTGTGVSSPITVTGLAVLSSYTCTVRATNDVGDSDESDGTILAEAVGSLDGTVKDFAAPKGTGAPYGAEAVVGVLVCEDDGPPGCAAPLNVLATTGTGAYSLDNVEEGPYELIPYYCRATSPSCLPGSVGIRLGSATDVVVNGGFAVTTTNLEVGFRPDAQARLLTGTLQGADTYVTTAGAAPTVAASIGAKRDFLVRVDNDGNLREAITVEAVQTGGTRFSFAYGINARSAADLARPGGRNIVLDGGESIAIRVAVTAKSNAVRGNVAQITLKTTSVGQAGTKKVDFVKMRVTKL